MFVKSEIARQLRVGKRTVVKYLDDFEKIKHRSRLLDQVVVEIET